MPRPVAPLGAIGADFQWYKLYHERPNREVGVQPLDQRSAGASRLAAGHGEQQTPGPLGNLRRFFERQCRLTIGNEQTRQHQTQHARRFHLISPLGWLKRRAILQRMSIRAFIIAGLRLPSKSGGGLSCGRSGGMPTLAVGMLEMGENYDMPTASVGMAPAASVGMAPLPNTAKYLLRGEWLLGAGDLRKLYRTALLPLAIRLAPVVGREPVGQFRPAC